LGYVLAALTKDGDVNINFQQKRELTF